MSSGGDIILKDADGKNVTIAINEFLEVKGLVFKVATIQPMPAMISLEPANVDQVRQYYKSRGTGIVGEKKETEMRTRMGG